MRLTRRRSLPAAASLVAAVLLASLLVATSASAAARKRDVLSLTAPAQVSTGQSAVLQGRLTDRSSHRPIRSGKVTFYYAKPNARSWTALNTVRTNGDGRYRDSFSIPATFYFTTRFSGNSGHVATWSPTREISIRSTIPPDGTQYWASNSCHYHVANRQWYGDYCVAHQTNSFGNSIPTVYNVYAFANSTASHVGALRYQLNTSDPNWIEWRVPSDPEFQTVLWAAVPRNNVNAEPKLWIDFQGLWQWTSVSQLQQLVATLQALLAREEQLGIAPAPTNLVTISGQSEASSQALTDLANGVDKLGGNAELGQAFSNVYSIGISEPFTAGPCGEYGWVCYPY